MTLGADGTFAASASGGELRVRAPGFADVVLAARRRRRLAAAHRAAARQLCRLSGRDRRSRRHAPAERGERDGALVGGADQQRRRRAGRRAATDAGLHPVSPVVVAHRESDDARRHAARRLGVGRQPHARAGRRRAAERSVRQLGVLEPRPAGGDRSRRGRARRRRRSLRRRRARRRHSGADVFADASALPRDARRRLA